MDGDHQDIGRYMVWVQKIWATFTLILADHYLDMDWKIPERELASIWMWAGHNLDVGWPLPGCGLAITWMWAGLY